jgi:hypothetical protein
MQLCQMMAKHVDWLNNDKGRLHEQIWDSFRCESNMDDLQEAVEAVEDRLVSKIQPLLNEFNAVK